MKTEVSTVYERRYCVGRKRTPETSSAYLSVPVEIREIEDGAFERAFSFSAKHPFEEEDEYRHYRPFQPIFDKDGDVTVYDVGGTLFVQRCPVDRIEEALALNNSPNPFNVYAQDADGTFRIGFDRRNAPEEVQSRAEIEISVLNDRKRNPKGEAVRTWDEFPQRAIGAATRRSEDLAVIDGWLCERVNEPVIVVRFDNDGGVSVEICEENSDHGPFSLGRSDKPHGMSLGSRFGLDQMATAMAFADRVAAEEGTKVHVHGEVSHAADWAVRFRGEAETLRRASEEVAKWGVGVLGSVDEALGFALFDLAHAINEHPGVTPPILDAVMQIDSLRVSELARVEEEKTAARLARLAAAPRGQGDMFDEEKEETAIASDGTGEYRFHHGRGNDVGPAAMNLLAHAVDLWNDRDAAGLDWSDRALRATGSYAERNAAFEATSVVEVDRLGRALGVDLSGMAADAARGAGHVIAVETAGKPSAAAWVKVGEDGVEIVDVVTRHGAKASESISAIVAAHVGDATQPKADGLDALGI